MLNSVIIDKIKLLNNNFKKLFFEELKNINWFEDLSKNHLLDLKIYGDNYSWEAFPYVKFVAKEKSIQVFDLINKNIDGSFENKDERLIYLIVFELGLNLNDCEFIKISKLFLQWIKKIENINFYYYKEFDLLIERLKNINQEELSCSILTELLRLNIEIKEENSFIGKKRTVFTEYCKLGITATYSYEKISEIALKYFPNSINLFGLLCDMYINLFNSLSDEQKDKYQSLTYFERAAIEYSLQDEYHHDVFYYYISCIRNIAENIFKEDNKENINKIIKILKENNIVFFKRILLHLLCVSDNISYNILEEALFNYDYLMNSNYYHEYFLLINKKYNLLKEEDKKAFLDIINKGLDEECCKKNNYNISDELNIYWKKRKFLSIKQYLSNEEKDKYKDYIDNTKITEEDKFIVYHRPSMVLGYSSPLDKGKLSEMKIDELIKYLNDFSSEEANLSEPSPFGLAEDLASDVKNDYKKYITNIEDFKDITKPIYIYYLLTAFRDSNFEICDWEKVIDFGCWIFDQKDEESENYKTQFPFNITWKGVKVAFIDLLNKFFSKVNKNICISKEFIEKSLSLLSDLSLYECNDLNEHVYNEKSYDYFLYAINSSFGRVFETLIFYIYWTEDTSEKIKNLLDEIYNKFSYLEKFAILGQYIVILNRVVPDWLKEHFDEIFPKNNLDIFKASFFTILEYSNLSDISFSLLKEEYEYVVHNSLFIENTNIMDRLARHICSYYIHGNISKEDTIIKNMLNIYENKPLRQSFIRLVGPIINNNSTITNDDLNRLMELWKLYKDIIKGKEEKYLDELKYFYFWYSSRKFNSDWILNELCELLENYNVKFDNWIIWDRLLNDLPNYPDKVFYIVKNLSKEYNFISISKDIIIETVKYITENCIEEELINEKKILINDILSRKDLADISFIKNLRLYL